jgi:hypothetical protein
LADIQPFASPRTTGETGPPVALPAGEDIARSTAGLATRCTIAFTRSSRVTRNGAAENIGNSFSGGGRISPADTVNIHNLTSKVNMNDCR